MESEKQVPVDHCVIRVIGLAANYDPKKMELGWKLQDKPLMLDSKQLNFLIGQLKALAKTLGGDESTIDGDLIRKVQTTVSVVIKHIQERLKN